MSLLLASQAPPPPPPSEKFFFGVKTGYAYMLSGAKLYNVNLGTVLPVENNTDFMVNRVSGVLMWKIQPKILDNA